jgi:DNA (cytosine-5)-methyltransferase 1
VTAGGGGKTRLVTSSLCAHIERYYSMGGQLSDIAAPLPTATAKARFGLSTAHLTQFNGRSEAQPLVEPPPSVTSRDRFGLVDVALEDGGGRYLQVRAFLRRWGVIGPEDEAEVVIDGVRCRIVDIGMRMLRPRELFRAQGFPESYVIAPPSAGKPLTLTSQVRMCGNSVPPVFAKALVTANYVEPWTADNTVEAA